MARVTVEDCIREVPNRFELVLLASQRARQISAGSPTTINRGKDKNPVVSLREIADKTLSLEGLWKDLVQGLQKHVQGEEPEEEFLELLSDEQSYAGEAQHRTEIEDLSLDVEISEDDEDEDMADEAIDEEE